MTLSATAGRSFWILDDITAIQNSPAPKAPVAIFKPKDTYLIFGGSSDKPIPGLGQNPKQGVTFDYYLDKAADSLDLELEVMHNGRLIRSITNKKPKDFKTWPGGPSKPQVLPSKFGYNRFTWDFRKENIPAIDKVFVYGNYAGSRVGPGTYMLRLTLEGLTSETQVTILPNPKVTASNKDFEDQQAVLDQIEESITAIHDAVNEMRSAKSQLENYAGLLKDNQQAASLLEKGKDLINRIDTWEQNLIQPKQKTFQDVINFNNKLNAQLMHLKGYVDTADPVVTQGAKERLKDLLAMWKTFSDERDTIVDDEMEQYNTLYTQLGLPAIIMKDN